MRFKKLRSSWRVPGGISALEGRSTFMPARKNRRAGQMSQPERKIMKTRNRTMKLIAVIAFAVATPQTGYTQRAQDVNVVNTPNVNAQQRGAWSVGINPSSNTVLVASSSREPVFTTQTLQVVNVFQKPMEIDLAEGYVQGSTSFTVPAGKLLVIEQVSGLAFMGGNNQFPVVSFKTTANNNL